jgi:hypothetical protein
MIRTGVRAHPDPARLTSTMPKLLNHTIKALLGITAQSFDALLATPRH